MICSICGCEVTGNLLKDSQIICGLCVQKLLRASDSTIREVIKRLEKKDAEDHRITLLERFLIEGVEEVDRERKIFREKRKDHRRRKHRTSYRRRFELVA